ncbi:ATP-binding protein [Litchfieldia alkalitelluris]|uniref:ATP-binding protein n=1 Tax=Litchfieldia alkalitelluris TaxID=304268 RepID=UPI001472A8AE|nr:ATP-binding protein [Litchfieldia alkalitelluris]
MIDEGLGIPQKELEKIGEPFYSTKENGTGLGIMVSNNIIKNNHKGSLEIHSEVNKGATFIIKLPFTPSLDDI